METSTRRYFAGLFSRLAVALASESSATFVLKIAISGEPDLEKEISVFRSAAALAEAYSSDPAGKVSRGTVCRA
jgi:hypothetical protein